MNFGDVYFFDRKYYPAPIGGHWVVLLYASQEENEVYFQTLSSQIHKLFPRINNLLSQNRCLACHQNPIETPYFQHNLAQYLDVEKTHILNKDNHSYLTNETFIKLDSIEKGNYFIIKSGIDALQFGSFGQLPKYNKQAILITLRHSGINNEDLHKINDFYKP